MVSQMVPSSADLQFALAVTREAGQIALKHFRAGVSATMKADNTHVTIADTECESFIRRRIAEKYPGDDILGEEEGLTAKGSGSDRKWIIDPIDGTYNFQRYIPFFSTLLALEENGEITVGIVNAPAMDEIFWAERGGGAFRNGERITVSTISKLEEAQFGFGAPSRILSQGYWDGLTRIIAATYRQRAFGDYLNFAHVFYGKSEAALEVGLKPWDLAPMKIIAEESGGRFTDLSGGASIYDGSCLITNGILHEQLLRMLLGN